MGSAAAEFPTFTGGILAQAGPPQPGEARQQHSEDSSMTWITGLVSLQSRLFGQTQLSHRGSSGPPKARDLLQLSEITASRVIKLT